MKRLTKEADIRSAIEAEHERTGGVFRLAPCWVGRPGIIIPGRRIKLRDDYINRDLAVNERWLASVTYADNGVYNQMCPEDHGFSYIMCNDSRIQLRDALDVCGDLLLGPDRQWDVLPKFFDNWHRIPFHLHPCDDHVRPGPRGKPESYHFPVELNTNRNDFASTYIGVDPALSDAELLAALRVFSTGNNRLSSISAAVDLEPGTGWYMPACTLHAPGSLVTYELQVASDVSCIPESHVNSMPMPADLLDRDLPVKVDADGEEAVYEHILKMIRCANSGNTDAFRKQYYRPPITVRQDDGSRQDFVIYRCGRASEASNPDLYSAKHTVVPGKKTWQIQEAAAFGTIVLSGHGNISVPGKEPVEVETASLYYTRNEIGADEIFVSAQAAKNLTLECRSVERLSIYQHFASDSNPAAATLDPSAGKVG